MLMLWPQASPLPFKKEFASAFLEARQVNPFLIRFGTFPRYLHNRPISARFQGVRSLRVSRTILVRRLESRARRRREVPSGRCATKHLEHMLGSEQRIDQPIETGAKWSRGHPGLRNKMPRF